MRLLLLNDRIPPESRGGAGVVFWRLAQGLRDAGHDVQVIAATENPSFEEIRDGIRTIHLHSQYADRWRAWRSLRNPQTIQHLAHLYREIAPEVINAHNVHADLSYASIPLAQRLGIPAVFTSHDVMPFAYHKMSYFINPAVCGVPTPAAYRLPFLFNLRQMRLRYNPWRNRRIRAMVETAAARTAVSAELASALYANGLPRFEVVHNGVDVERFHVAAETTQELRERLHLANRKVILFAGRLSAAKGTRQLLDALLQVVKQVSQALLLVLSSVPIAEQIADARYADLVENHMQSGGWLSGDDLTAAFQLADVVTVPSVVFDSFPTVNLEAMAAGKPVLTTCYGGGREAVRDGETGYVVNPFDTADFAQKLIRLLTDDALRSRMGAAALAHVRAHFTLTQQVAHMEAIFERVAR